MDNRFAGKRLVIATMHGKESVIAPILEKELGVTCMVPTHFDTDSLGTFSGEIERTLTPVEAAREKCKQAIALTGCDLAVASEGSFGPHPFFGFIPSDEELLLFYDAATDTEVQAVELSTETNFAGKAVSNDEALQAFAASVGFPEHGLIVKPEQHIYTPIVKGIRTWEDLQVAFLTIQHQTNSPTVFVETDMRAMYNPTRMKVIAIAAQKLVQYVQSVCPNCQTPGFVVRDMESGLPCGLCGQPTKSALKHIYSCKKCGFEQAIIFPKGKQTEDPMYCDYCNP